MEIQNPRYYKFGEFKLDSRRRILLKNDGEIPISAKNFELLFELVKNNGRILTHDELLDTVWAGTFVEQSNLKKGISALRQILGETPESSLYIKTIPRKGYSFVSPVQTFSDELPTESIHITATEIIIEEEIIEDEKPQISANPIHPQLAGKTQSTSPKYLFSILLSILFLTICGLIYWYFFSKPNSTQFTNLKLEHLKPQRLSTNGDVHESAISPDGKFFSYAMREADGKQSLWLRRIGTMNALQLVPPSEMEYRAIKISPLNDSIFYNVTVNRSQDMLYQIPILGGTPRKILEGIRSTVSFSPDGKLIAFVRDIENVGRVLTTFDLEKNGNEKEIYTVTGDNHKMIEPKWSPNGKSFAFIASEKIGTGRNWTISEISSVGTNPRVIVSLESGKIYDYKWLADGSGFVMSAETDATKQTQLWKVDYQTGKMERLSNDLFNYSSVSLSDDGNSILSIQEQRTSDLWQADFANPNKTEQISKNINLPGRFAITPDGRALAEIIDESTLGLSFIEPTNNNLSQFLTQKKFDRFPAISPDGKKVAFTSRSTGSDEIWTADINGGNLQKLTDVNTFTANPTFSPDGTKIFFEEYIGASYKLAQVPTNGGEVTALFQDNSYNFAISPDGKLLAHGFFNETEKKWKIGLRNMTDFSLIQVFNTASSKFIRFTPDGKSIIYNVSDLFQDGGNIWIQAISGGAPKPYLELKNEKVYWAEFSKDGKNLFYTRGKTTSSAVLLSLEAPK